MARLLVVFAKNPVAGQVKTRLSPPLSPQEAARLYAGFVGDLTARWSGWAGVRPVLAHWPASARAALSRLVPSGWTFVAQRGEGLAERMTHAFQELLAAPGDTMVLTNSDSPDLPRDRIERAFEELEDSASDLVFGPDEGGGYYLVGQRFRPDARIFRDIPMGGAGVLEATLRRCRDLGLRTALLEPFADVDTSEDLERLAARLRADVTCRRLLTRTTGVLCDLGRIPEECRS